MNKLTGNNVMKMNRMATVLMACALSAAVQAQKFAQEFGNARKPLVQVVATPSHADSRYEVGQQARLRIVAHEGGVPVSGTKVYYKAGPEMLLPAGRDSVTFANGEALIPMGTMQQPGFLACQWEFVAADGKKYSDLVKVAYQPEDIETYTSMPADFADFWQKALKEARKVPFEPEYFDVPDATDKQIETKLVRLRVGKNKWIYGYLSRPLDGKQHPVVLCPPGAGSQKIFPSDYYPRLGMTYMKIEIHDNDQQLPDDEYNRMRQQKCDGYMSRGMESRDTYYYKDVYVGCARAVDYLCSLPDWDGRNVIVTGGSQGGALTIVTSALNERVTLCAPFYPALCDLTGFLHQRAGGWPKFFSGTYKDGRTDVPQQQAVETLQYYDVVNFARLLRVPTFMSWGYSDDTCSPTSVWAAWNAINAPKTCDITPSSGHWRFPTSQQKCMQWMKSEMRKKDPDRMALWQGFVAPPDSIRVGCYYYWVNEIVDPKGVKADLEWMKQNGITLAFLATDIRNRTRWEKPWEGQTFGKNKFQSKLWWQNLRTALKTAGQLGIEMGIFNCPGWSQSGGPWIKPEEAMRNWTPQGIEVCKTKQGTDVANGPCSDEAEGLEVDKLSKTHVKKHFEAFVGEILRRIPSKDRPTLTTVVVDSWERGKQNYTDSIFVKFRQRYGYDLDYSKVVDPKSAAYDAQCAKDLDRLIADLVATEYMGGLTEKAHEYGLRTWCEPYAHSPFPGNSITYGSQADEVAAEFWVNDKKFRKKEVDAALGAARRSGKNRVWAESFTDGGWTGVAKDDWSFAKLKPIADRYFHAGINATILHVMISQPGDERQPAVRPWFGTFFDRRSQHAADLKPLVTYLRRCNFMLQLGQPYRGATDQRITADGTIIRFTDDSLFEVTFADGHREVWNPAEGVMSEK
ncbi:MAG: acetylxylan esterase [Prevotella sp.]|nr:acetylxylan esterase [Prevotella sp.]